MDVQCLIGAGFALISCYTTAPQVSLQASYTGFSIRHTRGICIRGYRLAYAEQTRGLIDASDILYAHMDVDDAHTHIHATHTDVDEMARVCCYTRCRRLVVWHRKYVWSLCLSRCVCVCLSVCVEVCVCVCLSVAFSLSSPSTSLSLEREREREYVCVLGWFTYQVR